MGIYDPDQIWKYELVPQDFGRTLGLYAGYAEEDQPLMACHPDTGVPLNEPTLILVAPNDDRVKLVENGGAS